MQKGEKRRTCKETSISTWPEHNMVRGSRDNPAIMSHLPGEGKWCPPSKGRPLLRTEHCSLKRKKISWKPESNWRYDKWWHISNSPQGFHPEGERTAQFIHISAVVPTDWVLHPSGDSWPWATQRSWWRNDSSSGSVLIIKCSSWEIWKLWVSEICRRLLMRIFSVLKPGLDQELQGDGWLSLVQGKFIVKQHLLSPSSDSVPGVPSTSVYHFVSMNTSFKSENTEVSSDHLKITCLLSGKSRLKFSGPGFRGIPVCVHC